MRELIRPTLLMIARLGLFLAVVAWIVGQWWHSAGFALGFAGVIDRTGIAIVVNSRIPTWVWGIDEQITRPTIQALLDGVRMPSHALFLSLSAVAFRFDRSNVAFIVGIKHWLVVTIFAVLNIVLHFVYRKRPEAQPCEN